MLDFLVCLLVVVHFCILFSLIVFVWWCLNFSGKFLSLCCPVVLHVLGLTRLVISLSVTSFGRGM